VDHEFRNSFIRGSRHAGARAARRATCAYRAQIRTLPASLDSIGPVDRVFGDKVGGGARARRPGLSDCLVRIRDDDTVRVASMDRLARPLADLQQLIDEIVAKGAEVQFVEENQTYSAHSSNSMGGLLL